MPKLAKELTALEVNRLSKPGFHAVGVVPGLHLQVGTTSRSWILRAMVGSRRRDIGLGPFPAVTLAQARERAREAREKIRSGVDPIVERQQARSALIAAQAAQLTFTEAARRFLDAKSPEWSNPKHVQQWVNTLDTYVHPKIGKILVAEVTRAHVLSILEPIWKTKTETATRVRGRIEQVLDWATARGYRSGENPARWKGHLDKLLAKPKKIAPVEHHAALPINDVGKFMVDLRKRSGMGAKALEFLILTAARSGEVRGAVWSEIDLDAAMWTIPAKRMKARQEHRVPLSTQAVALLRALPRIEGTELVFPGNKNKPLSDATLTAVVERIGVDAVPHGFRSTFRDWAAERTSYPRDLAEMALAHKIENSVEAAYRRGDMLERRLHMMQAWAEFCGTQTASAVVISFERQTA